MREPDGIYRLWIEISTFETRNLCLRGNNIGRVSILLLKKATKMYIYTNTRVVVAIRRTRSLYVATKLVNLHQQGLDFAAKKFPKKGICPLKIV